MIISSQKIFKENIILKVIACIIGYTIWFVGSQSHYAKIDIDVPVIIHRAPEGKNIVAPDHVRITLGGRKSRLRDVEFRNLAVHCDGSSLQDGENHQMISNKTLFLPEHIKLIHYNPMNLVIHVT